MATSERDGYCDHMSRLPDGAARRRDRLGEHHKVFDECAATRVDPVVWVHLAVATSLPERRRLS